jgi:hypothetical protein
MGYHDEDGFRIEHMPKRVRIRRPRLIRSHLQFGAVVFVVAFVAFVTVGGADKPCRACMVTSGGT